MAWCLKDKVGVVTGAAEGIGYEIARFYIKRGAKNIVLLDINEDKGKKAANFLNNRYGRNKAVFCKCDVTTDLKETFRNIHNSFKKVDILVNSAGIFNEMLPGRTIDINLRALVEWSLRYWHYMRKDKGGDGGTIINLSSIHGYRVYPYMPVYQATKFGILGFSKALGHEDNFCRSSVRVVAICPGYTKTSMTLAPKAAFFHEHMKFMKTQRWQYLDVVGNAAVEIYENAPSGTAWEIEGASPIAEV